ncbi:uncharacterized protein LOC135682068 [Rhopilema esculentum]|uniref:uncharacterized protein LOC135682068 n=1 Tax=Rhopilema esculentum TaxID=499914 RepID=UPI0031D8136A|eukprot:gene14074-5061_t
MKQHYRLKLPSIEDGNLISKFARQDGHDIYNSVTIEEEWTEQSTSGENSGSDDVNTSLSLRRCRRKNVHTLKGIASAILAQRCWAKEVRRKWETELKEVSNTKEQDKLSITFNAKAFKAHIQACGAISEEMRRILRKFSKFRTDDEVKVIGRLVNRLKVFEKYPIMVKEELGRILYFDVFEDGRIITKQGQSGISFYFIVTGTVLVERIEVDKQTGLRHIQRVDELGQGDSFGELALLHSNTKRAASMICRGLCEFLRIDRGEFEDVLQRCREKEWSQRATVLSELNALSGYSPRDLMVLNSNAKYDSYPPNSIILGSLKQRPDRVFFVVSGTCNVVRELIVIKRQATHKKYKYILPSHEFILRYRAGETTLDNASDTLETHFLIVNKLTKGDVFNIHDSTHDVYYISEQKTDVIHIAIASLARPMESFEGMKEQFAKRIPSREKVFNDMVAEVKWNCFKRNLARHVISQNKKRQVISKKSPYYDQPDII